MIKILFYFLLLFLSVNLFFFYKESIILFSSTLYTVSLVFILILINYFFLFVLYELTKYFFRLYISDGKLLSLISVWYLFSDNVDFISLKEIEDLQFKKTNILSVLFDFWKILINNGWSWKWKTIHCIDKPEKIIELLIKNK